MLQEILVSLRLSDIFSNDLNSLGVKEKARGGKELTRVKMLHFQKRSGEAICVSTPEEEKCVCLGDGGSVEVG